MGMGKGRKKRKKIKQSGIVSNEKLMNTIYRIISSVLFYCPESNKLSYEITHFDGGIPAKHYIRVLFSYKLNACSKSKGLFSYTFAKHSNYLPNISDNFLREKMILFFYQNLRDNFTQNEQSFLLDNIDVIVNYGHYPVHLRRRFVFNHLKEYFSGDALDKLNSFILLDNLQKANENS